MSGSQDSYPDQDYPWNFYFNGVLMPKWGSSWFLPGHMFQSEDKWREDFLEDFSYRDIELAHCKIDHVGVVESEDPGVFRYTVQEVLCLYLEHREEILDYVKSIPLGENSSAGGYPAEEILEGVVNAAFQMLELITEHQMAFWISGYEGDRLCLVDFMERTKLPKDDQRFLLAPHITSRDRALRIKHESQCKRLHQLAQSSQFSKEWRGKLHAIA